MALLQISEPGLSPDPHQRRVAVGIDLGTTHSLVACVRSGAAECLPDVQGRVLLPSVVHYAAGGDRQVGWEALAQRAGDPTNTVASIKRCMGRSLRDVHQRDKLPYRLTDHPGMVGVQTVQGEFSPVQISAEILAALRQRAEQSLGVETLLGAVITVPAYFDDAQRQATKDAARLAGLSVLRLINEPTAAAIAYGLDNASEGVYAVYDLGGGTFDVSILRLTQGVFEVVATGGDSALGGDDYDHALVDLVLQRSGVTLRDGVERSAWLIAARAVKEALSATNSVAFPAELTGDLALLTITRTDFEACTASLTARTMTAVRRVVRDAGMTPADVQGVVLVGGATRMPQIRKAVADWFGKPPLTNLNPDEVVALGAAIQANQLAGNDPDGELLLLDVVPLTLGLETMGGLVEPIISRNETIPTARAQDFTTYRDGQTALALHVVQGERDLVADCRSLARFELRGIPPMAAGAARIRVTFTVDADGLLGVNAVEQQSGVEASIAVKPSYGLSDEQITRMLQESFTRAEQDLQMRALVQAQVEADRLVLATESALAQDADLLSESEQLTLQTSMDAVRHSCAGTDAVAIEAATKALASASEPFAARRMNRGIQKALTGRNIAAV